MSAPRVWHLPNQPCQCRHVGYIGSAYPSPCVEKESDPAKYFSTRSPGINTLHTSHAYIDLLRISVGSGRGGQAPPRYSGVWGLSKTMSGPRRNRFAVAAPSAWAPRTPPSAPLITAGQCSHRATAPIGLDLRPARRQRSLRGRLLILEALVRESVGRMPDCWPASCPLRPPCA